LPISYNNENIGRITKGAAYAFLGKTYLQEHKYQEAHDALQWLVEGEGKSIYDLVSNYADNFSATAENNKESVFEIQFKAQQSVTDEDDPNSNMGNQREPFFGPSTAFNTGFNDLEMHRWVINEFMKEKTIDGKRDPRLAVTAIFDSTDERGPDFSKFWGHSFSELLSPTDKRCWYRKYENDQTSSGITFEGEKNVRVIRYAGVLLMYAEALNELGQTAAAYTYVDRVRQRAGLAKLSDVMPGLSKEAFLQQLMHERITELTGEDVRWLDLERWGFLDDQSKIDILRSRDFEFDNFKLGKNKYLPIPQSEIDINPNLKQNPMY
jgi:starch-binding outer membrane protein, SusD/RagB family